MNICVLSSTDELQNNKYDDIFAFHVIQHWSMPFYNHLVKVKQESWINLWLSYFYLKEQNKHCNDAFEAYPLHKYICS